MMRAVFRVGGRRRMHTDAGGEGAADAPSADNSMSPGGAGKWSRHATFRTRCETKMVTKSKFQWIKDTPMAQNALFKFKHNLKSKTASYFKLCYYVISNMWKYICGSKQVV